MLEYRHHTANARQMRDPAEQMGIKALQIACFELVLRVTDNAIRELAHRAVEARAGDLGGEQQRHADGDPEQRERLLPLSAARVFRRTA